MKKILMPLADGFEEIEAITLIDVLRRAGFEVTVAGIKPGDICGAHGIAVKTDALLDQVKDKEFDMMVLPGGMPGVDNLRKNPGVIDLLKKMNEKKKTIGAICAAPLVLQEAGLGRNLKMTGYPGVDQEMGRTFEKNRVVIDGHVMTSQGPGTAMEFALKIVETLLGQEQAKALSERLIAAKS